jgi:hypothetical protein
VIIGTLAAGKPIALELDLLLQRDGACEIL